MRREVATALTYKESMENEPLVIADKAVVQRELGWREPVSVPQPAPCGSPRRARRGPRHRRWSDLHRRAEVADGS